jgi:hypothetical protein
MPDVASELAKIVSAATSKAFPMYTILLIMIMIVLHQGAFHCASHAQWRVLHLNLLSFRYPMIELPASPAAQQSSETSSSATSLSSQREGFSSCLVYFVIFNQFITVCLTQPFFLFSSHALPDARKINASDMRDDDDDGGGGGGDDDERCFLPALSTQPIPHIRPNTSFIQPSILELYMQSPANLLIPKITITLFITCYNCRFARLNREPRLLRRVPARPRHASERHIAIESIRHKASQHGSCVGLQLQLVGLQGCQAAAGAKEKREFRTMARYVQAKRVPDRIERRRVSPLVNINRRFRYCG